jgi:hypothetical protein
MNKRFILTLISSPVLFTSMLSMVMMARPAHASQVTDTTGTNLSCVMSPHSATPKQVCIQVSNTPPSAVKEPMQIAQAQTNNPKELEFSDAESDLAIKLFGCDCPVCINAARQLNGLAPLPV